MFSKEAYSKNRDQAKRGQGDAYTFKVGKDVLKPQHGVFIPGQGIVMVNRKASRQRFVDRKYTRKRGYRGHVLPEWLRDGKQRPQELPYPPSQSNHQRMVERAHARQANRGVATQA